jgi:hypothetical protein
MLAKINGEEANNFSQILYEEKQKQTTKYQEMLHVQFFLQMKDKKTE